MEKRLIALFCLSVLLQSTSMPLMAAESKLQTTMKSFSQAVTNFKKLYNKCRQPAGCSPEEQRKLNQQKTAIAALGGAIVLAIGGTILVYLKRRPTSVPLAPDISRLAPGISSVEPYKEGQDIYTKEQQRREREQQRTEELQKMRQQQQQIEEEARQKRWSEEQAIAKGLLLHRVESDIDVLEQRKQLEAEKKEAKRLAREERRLKKQELEREQQTKKRTQRSGTDIRKEEWQTEQEGIRSALGGY